MSLKICSLAFSAFGNEAKNEYYALLYNYKKYGISALEWKIFPSNSGKLERLKHKPLPTVVLPQL